MTEKDLKFLGNVNGIATNFGGGEGRNQGRCYSVTGIAPCLNCMEGGGRQPHIVYDVEREILMIKKTIITTLQGTKVERESNVSQTLMARDYKGLPNQNFALVVEITDEERDNA